MTDRKGDSLLGGALRGGIAGAIGVWALIEADRYLTTKESAATRAKEVAARPGGLDAAHVAAERATHAVGIHMDDPAHNMVGTGIKYALGIVPGMLYGALRDRLGFLDAGRGAAFGIAFWAGGDQYAARAAGLTASPKHYPWQAHGKGFLAHVAYGLTLDAVLRVLKGPPR